MKTKRILITCLAGFLLYIHGGNLSICMADGTDGINTPAGISKDTGGKLPKKDRTDPGISLASIPKQTPNTLRRFSQGNRFVDNRDGTVTDKLLNLMWVKNGKPVLGALNWENANKFCNGLKYAEYNDWRLPTKVEMKSIVDKSYKAPSLPEGHPFVNVVTYLDYWTISEHTYGPGYAWAANFYYGKQIYLNKKKYAFPWPVRDLGTSVVASRKLPSWKRLQTRYMTVHYQTLKDIEKLYDMIQFSFATSGTKWLFSEKNAGTMAEKVSLSMDTLYERVQAILDMRKRQDRIAIKIYPTKAQLRADSTDSFRNPRGAKGLYSYDQNTISFTMDRMNTRRLARLMAYPIITHYMPVRPPEASVEILASYVNKHLAE